MTRQDFCNKYREMYPVDLHGTADVLMRVASNLSDLQIDITFRPQEEVTEKLNALKRYIFDYNEVLLEEARVNRQREREAVS